MRIVEIRAAEGGNEAKLLVRKQWVAKNVSGFCLFGNPLWAFSRGRDRLQPRPIVLL
jgi:hypothetical protein